MKAIVTIDLSTPQAVSLLGYLETLPFAEVDNEKGKWQQAINEGAVTADEFFDELDLRIEKRFRNA
jgi:hypothetical protein